MAYWNEVSLAPNHFFAVPNSPVVMYQARLTVQAAQGDFVQVFDVAAVPADGTQPLFSVPVDEFIQLDFGQTGRSFTSGIVVAISSTRLVYTHDITAKMLCDLLCYSS